MCKVREENNGIDRSNLQLPSDALLEFMRNSRIANMLHWFLMSETPALTTAATRRNGDASIRTRRDAEPPLSAILDDDFDYDGDEPPPLI